MLSRSRTTTALALGVATLALTTGAQAASAKGFDLVAGTAVTPGSARAAGSVTFPGAKVVKMTGKLNDRCPKDGYGAYIEFKVNFVGGGYGTKTFSDTRTCGAAAKSIAFKKTFPRKIKSVGVTVIELDQLGGGQVRAGDAARTVIRR